MAVIGFGGFETGMPPATSRTEFYRTAVGIPANGTVTIDSTVARTGYYCCKMTALNASATGMSVFLWPHSGTQSSAYVTFWLRVEALPVSTAVPVYQCRGSGDPNLTRVLLNTDGTLQLQRSDGTGFTDAFTNVGSPSSALSLNAWHRIDVSSLNTNSVGNFATELKLDGTSVASGTGFTLFTSSTITYTAVGGKDVTSVGDTYILYVDDIMWKDDAFVGNDGGVLDMHPDGNGNYTAWTGTFADVDEIPHDAAATIITDSTTTDAETATLESSAAAFVAGAITAVRPWFVGDRGATSGVTISTRIRSGAIDTNNTDANQPTLANGTWSYYGDVSLETDPNTGLAWTLSGLDAVETGVVATGGTVGVRNVTAMGLMVWCATPGQVPARDFRPVVTSVTPNVGPKAGGTAVTIAGSNFTGATAVLIGGVLATSLVVVSDVSITCTTAAVQKAGTYNVEVTNASGFGQLANAFTFNPGNPNGNGGNNAGGGLSLIVSTPTSPAPTDGDIMYAIVTVQGITNTVTQASWGASIHSRSDGTNAITFVFRKIAASEPASYTFTIGVSNKASGVIVSVPADVDITTQQIASQANASSLNIAAPTLTPKRPGAVSIFAGGTATGTTVTPPTGYTEPAGADSASTGGSVGTRTTDEAAYKVLTSTAATGTVTGVAAAAATNVGVQILLDVPANDPIASSKLYPQLLAQ